MLCPRCGHPLPDDATSCPSCGGDVRPLSAPTAEDLTWCPACGSVVSREMAACPYCGLPLFGQSDPLDPSSAEPVDPAERDTRLLPRMQNAIPLPELQEDDEPKSPRAAKSLLIACVAVGVVVLATVLVLAHPWDPHLYDTRASTPADTSMEGFPGTVERLSAQDKTAEETKPLTADEATFEALTGALETADTLSDELNQEMQDLSAAPSASDETRETWAKQAEATSIRISNLITEVQAADVTTGTYASSRDELVTMGNYLRNRADALTSAWQAILAPGASEDDAQAAIDQARASDGAFSSLYQEARDGFTLEEPEA